MFYSSPLLRVSAFQSIELNVIENACLSLLFTLTFMPNVISKFDKDFNGIFPRLEKRSSALMTPWTDSTKVGRRHSTVTNCQCVTGVTSNLMAHCVHSGACSYTFSYFVNFLCHFELIAPRPHGNGLSVKEWAPLKLMSCVLLLHSHVRADKLAWSCGGCVQQPRYVERTKVDIMMLYRSR